MTAVGNNSSFENDYALSFLKKTAGFFLFLFFLFIVVTISGATSQKYFLHLGYLKPTVMNLIDRVKNILLMPQKEWHVINSEPGNTSNITTTYILPLTLIGALAAFIGFGFLGVGIGVFKIAGVGWGIKMALGYAIRSILGVFIAAFIIDALASNFGSEKNFDKSFQVAAYSATAGLVGGIFLIVPALSILALLASLYGLYLLYLGLPILKKTPADKAVSYFVVVLVVSIIVGVILYYIQNLLFYPRLELMLE